MNSDPEIERKNLTFATLDEYLDDDGRVRGSIINAGFPFTFWRDDVPTVEHVHALLDAWYGNSRTVAGSDEQGYSYLVEMPHGYYIVDISANMGVNMCIERATLHEALDTFNELCRKSY